MEKKLRVTCDTKLSIPLDELVEVQGELKSFSEESYAKFAELVKKRGIWFPTFVVKEPTEIGGKRAFRWCVVDGTGRRRMFLRMREEGYEIPPIPAVAIEAGSREEMREAILAASSHFHKITEQGLFDFMLEGNLTIADLDAFDLPMDMERFEESFFGAPPEPDRDGATELERGSFTKFSQECPKCGFSFDAKDGKKKR